MYKSEVKEKKIKSSNKYMENKELKFILLFKGNQSSRTIPTLIWVLEKLLKRNLKIIHYTDL